MLTTAHDLLRLAIAARVIARHDGFIEPEQLAELPPQLALRPRLRPDGPRAGPGLGKGAWPRR